MNVFIDAGPLGQLCNPGPKYRPFRHWLAAVVQARQHQVFVSEVSIYEVRRELLRVPLLTSVERLDEMSRRLTKTTPDPDTWRAAGELWAWLRNEGLPTDDDARLDFDVVLAAEARIYDAYVITRNERHLARMVRTLSPEEALHRIR